MIKDLIEKGAFYSGRGILGKDETTEMVEMRKLNKDEWELFGQMLDLAGKVRGGEKEKEKAK